MASQGRGVSEIAGRYATALFDLADDKKMLDEVASDLRGLKDMLSESEDLRRMVRSPVLTRADQGHAMTAVLEKAKAGALTRNFVALAASNRRLFALPQMIDSYLAMLAARRGEVTAEVTAANPLSEAQEKTLAETLKKLIGAKVAVNLRVDRDLLGGLVVKVGSRLFDSSLRTKLRKLELAMKGVG
ncbi:MAG TPA: F0F1 ATP synthase subunit delta [Alphaproteobacteria bacterium]|nr:F0F1 ATP synthase subunit delta [Alphaproteobacteria bacterium]